MFDQNELKNLSRTVMQVEYLLLSLVLLFLVIPGAQTNTENRDIIILSGVWYAAILLILNYALKRRMSTGIMSVKAILTFAFISISVWFTGKSESPLILLYIIGIVSSAMVLGKSATFLMVWLVSVSLVFLDYSVYSLSLFSIEHVKEIISLVINIFALFLIAYLSFMLTSYMQDAKERIKNSAEIDGLTGLLNRRAFLNTLTHEHEKFLQYSQHFSVIMVDVDNLKTLNDYYGYPVGDRILVLISHLLSRSLKAHDLIARWGSDEYIILAAGANGETAYKLAERLRTLVDTTPLIMEGGKEIYATVSMGIGCFPDDSSDFDELIKRADFAMYDGKEKGKNRSILYSNMFQDQMAE